MPRKISVLYYAMGGGLGHLARTYAVLRHLNCARASVRVLASSALTPLAAGSFKCPVDVYAPRAEISFSAYVEFITEYIREHRIGAVIVDSFPMGIAGELAAAGRGIPRYLIARSLKWQAYRGRICFRDPDMEQFPQSALVIEPPDEHYKAVLESKCIITKLNAPVLEVYPPRVQPPPVYHDRCLVIHTGNENERAELHRYAVESVVPKNNLISVDTLFPDRNIFPASPVIAGYAHVVSAAGYNMAAAASSAPDNVRYHLYPFDRVFDDQHARAERIENGLWKDSSGNGAIKAAKAIEGWIAGL